MVNNYHIAVAKAAFDDALITRHITDPKSFD